MKITKFHMSIVFLMATILEYLQTPNKLVGIILAMLGFAFSILAKKLEIL